VRLLPFVILIIFAVIRNGAILSTYGYYMPSYTLGGLLCLTGGVLMDCSGCSDSSGELAEPRVSRGRLAPEYNRVEAASLLTDLGTKKKKVVFSYHLGHPIVC
jgi:hypothetical protein